MVVDVVWCVWVRRLDWLVDVVVVFSVCYGLMCGGLLIGWEIFLVGWFFCVGGS